MEEIEVYKKGLDNEGSMWTVQNLWKRSRFIKRGLIVKKLAKFCKKIPSQSGVYLMKDIKNQVIYIGKAKNLKSRVRSYFLDDKSFKNKFLTPRVYKVDYILTDTESEAYLLEARLIKQHKPRYNVRLKDDKSYPYIRCSIQEDFPRFYMERKVKNRGSLYFGPWTSVFFVRQMIHFLNEQFMIRDCSLSFMKSRKKPCLTYDIGHCPAPCVKPVSSKAYKAQVKKALSFLKGKSQKSLLTNMKKTIKKLAREERFEEAKVLRDRMQAIEFFSQRKLALELSSANMDIWAFYGEKSGFLFEVRHIREGALTGDSFQYLNQPDRDKDMIDSLSALKKNAQRTELKNLVISLLLQYYMDHLIPEQVLLPPSLVFGQKELSEIKGGPVQVRAPQSFLEKELAGQVFQQALGHFKEKSLKQTLLKKGLVEIQKKFGLKALPFRMECFDVSHLQGQAQVASQVVFENGVPKKEDYRKYKIKTAKPKDDFGSLKEVLIRRFRHKEYGEPDLLLVDGGRGQLKKALEALKETGQSHIPLVSIAKKRTVSDFASVEVKVSAEKFYLPHRKNALILSTHSPALKILCHLRDEAHRFAITYHRKKRERTHLGNTGQKK